MKLFTVALFAIAFSTGAMAKTIDGDAALKLRASLIKAGAEARIMVEASLVDVTKVKCSQEGGIVLLPLKCSFVDEHSGSLKELEGKEAQALATALTTAGVKSSSERAGEHTSLNIASKSISCSTMAMHHVYSCEIK